MRNLSGDPRLLVFPARDPLEALEARKHFRRDNSFLLLIQAAGANSFRARPSRRTPELHPSTTDTISRF